LFVADLNSKNGTRIERADASIIVGEQPVALQPGDVVATIENVELARVEAVSQP
jgi:hypothetical protein